MTKEDIIRMAREAGMEQDGDNFFSPSHEEIDVHITDLERFAALVAAAEREACAKECEDEIKRVKPIYSVVAENVLKAIRARGNQ